MRATFLASAALASFYFALLLLALRVGR